MKILSTILFLAISVPVWAANVSLPYFNPMNSLSDFGVAYTPPTITTDSSSPDSPNVMRFTYPAGFSEGNAPGIVSVTPANKNELYIQYYFKYSSNWSWNPSVNKQMYVWDSTGATNFYVGVGMFGHSSMVVMLQGTGGQGSNGVMTQQTSPVTINANTWYKVTLHIKMNTSSNVNGVLELWFNDVRVLNTTCRFWNGGAPFGKVTYSPVWGGNTGLSVPSTQYLYFDALRIQDGPIGASTPPPVPDPVPSTLQPSPPASLSIN